MIDFSASPCEVAPLLLGCTLTHGRVSIRITEVEAYLGAEDEASHAFRGKTPRNAAMFGPPGRLYVYRSYGIHNAGNIVCWPEGQAGAVLLRAGEVTAGVTLARTRRHGIHDDVRLAQGPGNFGQAIGWDLRDNHAIIRDATNAKTSSDEAGLLLTQPETPQEYVTGPRIGITKNPHPAWRFYIPGEATVSRPRSVRNNHR
ncbi:DNA-3-methyladenine glycosylase [Corynebacterium sp.]|uniref:DNA-3-methyladenine glycosylase n=1 Tax=Corynebacterium sp. TaxID=1720 RepID=UPI0026DBD24A|nr:DNA-3-methyladenine glycosylase [Corynebacterium sp.]MDO5077670.1 DNA-3-methyladenine glycosylase [Corynebacterium sp.]